MFTVVGVFNYKASMVGFVVCLSLAFILQIFMAHEVRGGGRKRDKKGPKRDKKSLK